MNLPVVVRCAAVLIPCLQPVALPGQWGAGRPGLLLPRIGTVGDLPPAETSIEVAVDREGVIRCEGRELDFEGLIARLKVCAADHPGEELPGGIAGSELGLVLRMDRDLPVCAVYRIVESCAQGDLAIWRIFFAVGSDSGQEDGALALFLPYEPSTALGPASSHWQVHLDHEGEPADPRIVYPVGRQLLERLHEAGRRSAGMTVIAAGDVPFGTLLRAIDAALRAGFRRVYWDCRPATGQDDAWSDPSTCRDLRALVRATPRTAWDPGIRLGEVPLLSEPETLPFAPRVRGAYAGICGWIPLPLPEPEEPLRDEDVVEIVDPIR